MLQQGCHDMMTVFYFHCTGFSQQYINSVHTVSHTVITLFTFQITNKAYRWKGHNYDWTEKSQKQKISCGKNWVGAYSTVLLSPQKLCSIKTVNDLWWINCEECGIKQSWSVLKYYSSTLQHPFCMIQHTAH
jgi:predicted metalloendopeptidase